MRALTGCAHAGYAALHVREMLSHGDSDPLHKIRVSVSVELYHPQSAKRMLGQRLEMVESLQA